MLQDYYRAVVALVSEGDFGSPGLGPGLMGFGPDLGGMGMASNGHFNMGPLGGRGIGNGGGPQGGHGRGRGRFGGRGGPPSDRSRPPPPDLAIKVGDELEGGADRDGHSPTGILKMRGLPFSAVVEDIVHWFNTGDLSIQPIAPDWYGPTRLPVAGETPVGCADAASVPCMKSAKAGQATRWRACPLQHCHLASMPPCHHSKHRVLPGILFDALAVLLSLIGI